MSFLSFGKDFARRWRLWKTAPGQKSFKLACVDRSPSLRVKKIPTSAFLKQEGGKKIMPTPPKPHNVIVMEGKSHRTKRELEQRKEAEEQLLSGEILKERREVRDNPIAHKEFQRINKILKKIGKNDAIYEPVINRFCILQAECAELEKRREEFYQLTKDLKDNFDEAAKEMDAEDKIVLLIELSRELAKVTASMINCDKQVQAKRKMLLDIEKENIMTIAAALRSIPKKAKDEEDDDPMTALLNRRVR